MAVWPPVDGDQLTPQVGKSSSGDIVRDMTESRRGARGVAPGMRTGRRPGDSGAREDILAAALARFAAEGYEKTSVRAVARDAGVDPALIRHYFTNKAGLFVAAVSQRTGVVTALAAAGPHGGEGRGTAFVRAYLNMWEDDAVRPALIALVRSISSAELSPSLFADTLTATFAHLLEVDSNELAPFALAGSQLLGIAMARYVVGVPALAELTDAEIVARVGPALDLILDGPGRA